MAERGMGDNVAGAELRAIIERIERLEEEKAALAEDIREVYGEAKGNGFAVKIIRKIVAARKRDHASRQEEAAMLELYCEAIGQPDLFGGVA